MGGCASMVWRPRLRALSARAARSPSGISASISAAVWPSSGSGRMSGCSLSHRSHDSAASAISTSRAAGSAPGAVASASYSAVRRSSTSPSAASRTAWRTSSGAISMRPVHTRSGVGVDANRWYRGRRSAMTAKLLRPPMWPQPGHLRCVELCLWRRAGRSRAHGPGNRRDAAPGCYAGFAAAACAACWRAAWPAGGLSGIDQKR